MTNNGAIVQQLTAKQPQSPRQTLQSDNTDDARIQARKDAIEWGQAYKKFLYSDKEEVRRIIQEKIFREKDEQLESLDLDESMFFSALPGTSDID